MVAVTAASLAVLCLHVIPALTASAPMVTHRPSAVTASSGPAISQSHKPTGQVGSTTESASEEGINISVSTTTFSTTISTYSPVSTSSATSSSALAASSSTLPACRAVQHDFPTGRGGNPARAAAVKEAYLWAWDAYDKSAFGYDEFRPLTATATNDWYGWGVTIVDGIDTAIIMGLTDVVAKQLAFINSIDFTTTSGGDVELFDVTIRYLGGLLSAYDLLTSGSFPVDAYNSSHIEALLTQAQKLADKLAFGFNTASGINAAYVDFSSNTPVEVTYTDPKGVTYYSTNTASAGSYLIEWYRLADLTGNATYRALVDRGEHWLVNPSPAPVYPGLVGTQFDTTAGRMLNYAGGWHSEVDSFLEYLIKIYQYRADNITADYATFWTSAAQSTVDHLALHPYGFPDLTFLSEMDDTGAITYTQDDYSCFAGGNFLLGCKVLGLSWLCDLGVAAADGCHQTYNSTITGIGPFYWGWYVPDSNTYPPDAAVDVNAGYRAWAARHGYFIASGAEGWGMFPESIESWFYAYRITGHERWQEYAWEVFLAINETARNSVAFAEVNNVNMPFGGSQSNSMDSFFFAEVLKYLYLIFEDPTVVSLDEWVFNTECHPVKIQCQ